MRGFQRSPEKAAQVKKHNDKKFVKIQREISVLNGNQRRQLIRLLVDNCFISEEAVTSELLKMSQRDVKKSTEMGHDNYARKAKARVALLEDVVYTHSFFYVPPAK